jgi:DNA invertase Pin-like site-specific DNA recombinase
MISLRLASGERHRGGKTFRRSREPHGQYAIATRCRVFGLCRKPVRHRFDVLMVWSIDRLGRSVLHVASAMAEMDAAGVALYSDQQAIDSTSPFGKAMMQMACVFGELEREMIRARVRAGLSRVREQGLKKLGRPSVGKKVEEAIRKQLGAGHGMLTVAKMVGCGSGTVQRVKREIAAKMAEAA